MKINWKVRISNPNFWLTFFPALFLLIQVCLAPFGYEWDFGVLNQQVADIVNAVFGLLAILGVVTDPTTPGVADSNRALTYIAPGKVKNQNSSDLE